MSLQSKFTMRTIVQKEQDNAKEERQKNFLALSKELEATQKLLDVNILIAEKTLAPPGASAWSKIADLSTKIESLLSELEGLQKAKSSAGMNEIVSRVLEHASISMGIPKKAISNMSGKADKEECDVAGSTTSKRAKSC